MKKEYVLPSVELFGFEPVDIITASASDEEHYRPGVDGGNPPVLGEDEMGPNA
ncbi:MAG: hypothetical protein IJ391_08200 [Clostridia bacterium]|nr:hypothetical protein [Clostridia bacterium]